MSIHTDELLTMYTSENLVIHSMCYQSRPCMHTCSYKGTQYRAYATDIVKLIKEDDGVVPEHFKYAEKLVEKEQLRLEKEEWLLDIHSYEFIGSIFVHRLYADNKSEVLSTAIQYQRLDIIDRVLDDISPTCSHFLQATNHVDIFKLLERKLTNKLIIYTNINRLASRAVSNKNLKLLKYLVEEKNAKVSEHILFSLKDLKPCELRTYILEKMIEHKSKIKDPYNILKIQNIDETSYELYEYLVLNNIIKKPEYNISYEYIDSEVLGEFKSGSLIRRHDDTFELTYGELFNFDIFCNTNLVDLHEYSLELLTMGPCYMIEFFKIKFSITNTSIKSYCIKANDDIIVDKTSVSDNEIVFKPLEPFYRGAAIYTQVMLHLNLETPYSETPIEESYIRDIKVTAKLLSTMSVTGTKHPEHYVSKITNFTTVMVSCGMLARLF